MLLWVVTPCTLTQEGAALSFGVEGSNIIFFRHEILEEIDFAFLELQRKRHSKCRVTTGVNLNRGSKLQGIGILKRGWNLSSNFLKRIRSTLKDCRYKKNISCYDPLPNKTLQV
jgi:hypothetical protein